MLVPLYRLGRLYSLGRLSVASISRELDYMPLAWVRYISRGPHLASGAGWPACSGAPQALSQCTQGVEQLTTQPGAAKYSCWLRSGCAAAALHQGRSGGSTPAATSPITYSAKCQTQPTRPQVLNEVFIIKAAAAAEYPCRKQHNVIIRLPAALCAFNR